MAPTPARMAYPHSRPSVRGSPLCPHWSAMLSLSTLHRSCPPIHEWWNNGNLHQSGNIIKIRPPLLPVERAQERFIYLSSLQPTRR